MADYYTQGSFKIKCNAQLRADLLARIENERADDDSDLQISVEVERDGVWLSHDENISVKEISTILHEWLVAYDDAPKYVAFEYGFTCSRPLLDAFGGGAAFITREGADFFTTARWMDEKIASLGPVSFGGALSKAPFVWIEKQCHQCHLVFNATTCDGASDDLCSDCLSELGA